MGFVYRMASRSEYLAITGYGINDGVKLAKKAWIAPGQRCTRFDISPVNYTFEVQAMSAEKLPFSLAAAFTIGPRADDEECLLRYAKLVSPHDNMNELVKGVIEGETRVLAASMTMEEIFRGTKSFQQAVFQNVQLELHQFGLIIYNANVKLQVERRNARQTEMLKAEHLSQSKAVFDYEMKYQIKQEVESRDGDRSQQLAQSYWRKMVEITERALQSLKPRIRQVVYGNNDTTAGQLKEQKKSWSNYALKALFFAITMFCASVYQNQSTPAAFSLGYRLFLVAIFVSVVMDTALIILQPSWGNVLVFVSWLLSEAASCLLILSFNERYALAILAFLFLILVVALLQPKLKHAMKRYDLPSFTNGDTQDDIDDEENKYLGYLFELAQGIVNCGGMVTAIFGHYMVGPVTAVGFFFFCSIALGLYLMMVITVRAVARSHVTCLAIVLMVLLVITLITVSIPFARHSG